MDIKSNIANLFKIMEEIGSDKQYGNEKVSQLEPVSYTHLRAHETR